MQYFICILLIIAIIIGSILIITLNLLYKDIIKEFYNYLERDDKNDNFK